jgi:hypothetical protein
LGVQVPLATPFAGLERVSGKKLLDTLSARLLL